jgi:predicted patatin/cPLA2 family phospholipase
MEENPKKIILYLGGGAMSGIYGAGVLKGLNDFSLTDKIESIYAGSAGSFNAAYFLAGQIELGQRIYWEDLQNNFIFRKNIARGILDLLKNRFIKKVAKEKFHNAVNINYLCDVAKSIKKLNLKNIEENPINLFIEVLNIESGEVEYLNFREFPKIDLLKAATSVKPYFFEETEINGKHYIDGTIKEPIGFPYLKNKYPDRKILIVLNEPIKRGLRHYVEKILEGSVSALFPYKIPILKIFLQNENIKRTDIKKALNDPLVLLLYPDFKNRVLPKTTNPSILKSSFYHGVEDSKNVLSFINK